jgi:GNAT superfamily N-acetyltransferase
MTSINIREANEPDLPMILSLHEELASSQADNLSLKNAEYIFQRIKIYPNYKIFVAEIQGQIVGTLALLIMDNLAHSGSPSGIVEDLVVAKEWQGQGVGKAMMAFAMKQCSRSSCYKLVLSSNSVRTQAHEFYERLGFAKHGYSYIVEQEPSKVFGEAL